MKCQKLLFFLTFFLLEHSLIVTVKKHYDTQKCVKGRAVLQHTVTLRVKSPWGYIRTSDISDILYPSLEIMTILYITYFIQFSYVYMSL